MFVGYRLIHSLSHDYQDRIHQPVCVLQGFRYPFPWCRSSEDFGQSRSTRLIDLVSEMVFWLIWKNRGQVDNMRCAIWKLDGKSIFPKHNSNSLRWRYCYNICKDLNLYSSESVIRVLHNLEVAKFCTYKLDVIWRMCPNLESPTIWSVLVEQLGNCIKFDIRLSTKIIKWH